MRLLKFRAYDRVLNKMVYNVGITTTGEGFIYLKLKRNWRYDKYSIFEKEDVTQYTGLKDKNGVDIYDGDIVTVSDLINSRKKPRFARVICENLNHTMIESLDNHTEYGVFFIKEVVGNIYQNKELIK